MKKPKVYFLTGVILLVGVYFWHGFYWPKEPGSTAEIIVSVNKGEGSKEIAENLEAGGIIRSAAIFRMYAIITGISHQLKAGKYALSPKMSIAQIAKKISRGEVIKEKITIIEGWNVRDIASYLEKKGLFPAELVIEKGMELEGYLFPDTYEITHDLSIEEVLEMMKRNFQKKTANLEISPDIIIMASLIEKEVSNPRDRRLVSGILWKRLKAGIPLQVDATITYITGKKTTKISKEETEIDSPYNTYKYLGLPPAPIANPGIDSILAALYPEDSSYWYYLSTPKGETVFSKTLEEHNIAKAKYLR